MKNHRKVLSESERVNWLASKMKKGQMADRNWLSTNGIESSQIKKLVDSRFLVEIVPRVFLRPLSAKETEVEWEFIVSSLQDLMELPIHVGAHSALELQGVAHQIRLGRIFNVELSTQGATVPGWINKVPSNGVFNVRRVNRLFDADSPGIMNYKGNGLKCRIRISTLERAMCEYLDRVKSDHMFHHADMLVDSSSCFRTKEIQRMLEICKSRKVKRLYLFLGERNQLHWVEELDLDKIDLGKRKMKIALEGDYDPKYRITVSSELDSMSGYVTSYKDWPGIENF